MQASCYQLSQSQKKLTCKRPPSPKCSTSRMLSDCMKAVDRQSKFPWGLNISKQCHAGWCSVCKWLSRGVSDLDTITHQATQRTEETGNHYSHFAIIRCLHMSQVSSWLRSVENHIVSLSRVLLCKRSYSCHSFLKTVFEARKQQKSKQNKNWNVRNVCGQHEVYLNLLSDVWSEYLHHFIIISSISFK